MGPLLDCPGPSFDTVRSLAQRYRLPVALLLWHRSGLVGAVAPATNGHGTDQCPPELLFPPPPSGAEGDKGVLACDDGDGRALFILMASGANDESASSAQEEHRGE